MRKIILLLMFGSLIYFLYYSYSNPIAVPETENLEEREYTKIEIQLGENSKLLENLTEYPFTGHYENGKEQIMFPFQEFLCDNHKVYYFSDLEKVYFETEKNGTKSKYFDSKENSLTEICSFLK